MAPEALGQLGTNVRIERDGDEVLIFINVTEDHGPSSTGKTRIVANTHGFITIPGVDGLKLNVTAVRKA